MTISDRARDLRYGRRGGRWADDRPSRPARPVTPEQDRKIRSLAADLGPEIHEKAERDLPWLSENEGRAYIKRLQDELQERQEPLF